jgi:uncharacterized protein (TIGR02452 family)
MKTPRTLRAEIAAETVHILDQGFYCHGHQVVSIKEDLSKCRENTRLHTPSDVRQLADTMQFARTKRTLFEVRNVGTFAAAKALIEQGFEDPVCLNFASARNPGGGFLNGSQAQEECLARASGLYDSLRSQPFFYQANRDCGSALYTDHCVYSPAVPVIRDDWERLLPVPYAASIITCPAVNAFAVRSNEPAKAREIEKVMRHRIRAILAIAQHHGHRALVLGAWGCGVFGNSPEWVAGAFLETLTGRGSFAGVFERVVFAVLDTGSGSPTNTAFERAVARFAP